MGNGIRTGPGFRPIDTGVVGQSQAPRPTAPTTPPGKLGQHTIRPGKPTPRDNARALVDRFVPKLGTGRANGGWMALRSSVLGKNPELREATRSMSMDDWKAAVGQFRAELRDTAGLLGQDDSFAGLGDRQLQDIAGDVLANVLRRAAAQAESRKSVEPQAPSAPKQPPRSKAADPPSRTLATRPPPKPEPKSGKGSPGFVSRLRRMFSRDDQPKAKPGSARQMHISAMAAHAEHQQTVSDLKKLASDRPELMDRKAFVDRKVALTSKYARKFLPGTTSFRHVQRLAHKRRSGSSKTAPPPLDKTTRDDFEHTFMRMVERRVRKDPLHLPSMHKMQAMAVAALTKAQERATLRDLSQI